MPLYDYKCKKCEYVFEVQQRITEAPLKHCPKCKGEIFRLISAAGVVFKGSGFYVTDSGKSKQYGVSSKQRKSDNKKTDSKKTEKPTKPKSSEVKG